MCTWKFLVKTDTNLVNIIYVLFSCPCVLFWVRSNENRSKCNLVHILYTIAFRLVFVVIRESSSMTKLQKMLKSLSMQTDDKTLMHGSSTLCEVPAIQCVNQYGLLISPPPSISSVSGWCWQWDEYPSTSCTVCLSSLIPFPFFFSVTFCPTHVPLPLAFLPYPSL